MARFIQVSCVPGTSALQPDKSVTYIKGMGNSGLIFPKSGEGNAMQCMPNMLPAAYQTGLLGRVKPSFGLNIPGLV